MKVHFISGLGADERVFQYLDLPEVESVYVKWERPLKNETLSAYAKRLLSQIDTSEEPVIVGMSFGGLVAQEIAKLIPCRLIILIASVKSYKEYDWKLQWVKYTKVYKILPPQLLKWSNRFTADYYFSSQNNEESQLLQQIIKDTDEWFLTWAIDKIMNWDHITSSAPVLHIHGAKDRIFPYYKLKGIEVISDGGHFMIVSKSKEVSSLILQNLFIR